MYKNVKRINNFYVINVGEFSVLVRSSDYTSFVNSVRNTTMNAIGGVESGNPNIQVMLDARGKPSVGFYSALVVKSADQVREILENPRLFDLFSDYVPLHVINKVNPALSIKEKLLKTRYKEYRAARRRAGMPLSVE